MCLKYKKLIKAHVISKALFASLFKYGPVHEIGIADLDAKNRVQDAVYDTNILCAECDGDFSSCEKYFIDLLDNRLLVSNKIALQSRHEFPEHIVDRYADVDHFALRKFFLITLWRCAVSKRSNYRHVELGQDAEVLREMILSNESGNYGFYGTLVVALGEVDDVRTETVIFPQPANFGNFPVIILMVNRIAIIYNLMHGETPFLFKHQLNDSTFFDIVRFKHEPGLLFLDKLTGLEVRVKRSKFGNL